MFFYSLCLLYGRIQTNPKYFLIVYKISNLLNVKVTFNISWSNESRMVRLFWAFVSSRTTCVCEITLTLKLLKSEEWGLQLIK